jgi:phosphoribosyl-AMP cyclohydrolase
MKKNNICTNNVLTRLSAYRMESRSRQHLWRVGENSCTNIQYQKITTSIMVKFSLVTNLWVV